ncbi:DnaK family domain containing protein [Babesia divergens]|uniref:DnaK family domain containing protein n=1 Tax=Babesia divergens TaxID=32595 RepID=A0AAD9LLS8_BABDI|nr:DnaK family domain containing protein [Babesia divergens]
MRSLIAICLIFTGVCSPVKASTVTIGVDWGEEFVEVAIAFRGHKPDILLNDTGSRKFINAVYMDGTTRFFDQKAAASLIKTPKKTVHKSAHILGLPLDANGKEGVTSVEKEDVLRMFQENGTSFDWDYMPYEFGSDTHGQLYLNITKHGMLQVEVIAGHFFSYIRDIVVSKLTAAKVIKEETENPTILAVIAIPCNYTQKQRQAITFAAESAGITVAQLVHGITAASTMRAFEQGHGTKKVLFYDLGSSGANVGVIEMHVPEKHGKSGNKLNETQVKVLSCVHQAGVGGRHHDVALAEHLRNVFEQKTGVKLMPDHPYALQKLLKAANKAKVALTISDTTSVSIEGLIRNTDFQREVITRDTFNQTIQTSMLKLQEAIDLALERAGNITLEQLDGVELIGGAWRVPAVQEKLSYVLKPHTLGFHLNAEEAVAMGSGYLAAAHNPFFKMKSAAIMDNSVHMYAVRIVSIDNNHEAAIEKRTALFKPDAKLQGSKSLVFKTTLDFKMELTENEKIIAQYQITGITEVMSKEENKHKTAQITVVFRADERGIIGISKASAFIVDNETVDPSTTEAEPKSENSESNKEAPKDEKHEEQEKGKEKEEKQEDKPVTIDIKLVMTNPLPFSPENLEVAKKAIEELRQRDIDINKRSEMKNTLESLIYKYKSAAKQEGFQAACDNETLEEVKGALKDLEEWFDEESYVATLHDFEERIDKLQGLALPLYNRWADNEARPGLVASTDKALNKLENTLEEILKKKPYVADKTEIIDTFRGVKQWWQEALKNQETQLPHQEPVFTADLVKIKIDIAREALAALDRIKPPKISKETEDKEKQDKPKSDEKEEQPNGSTAENIDEQPDESKAEHVDEQKEEAASMEELQTDDEETSQPMADEL